jgi:uncharacterized membrane protein
MARKIKKKPENPENWKRSLVKSGSYRLMIMAMDFATVHFFTGSSKMAVGFVLISNVYTTVAYFAHERLWGRISWGLGR